MIRFAHNTEGNVWTKAHFLALLQILNKYPFPPPCGVLKKVGSTQTYFDIKNFVDPHLLKVLCLKRTPVKSHSILVDNASDEHLNMGITLGLDNHNVFVFIQEKLFLSYPQIKAFFYEIMLCKNWYEGRCGILSANLYNQNFSEEEQAHKTMLDWLQYFSLEKVKKHGGFAAFELNPYLQTERIHDGLFIQVGDDPAFFDTPEGAKLLVNAVNALPLVKH